MSSKPYNPTGLMRYPNPAADSWIATGQHAVQCIIWGSSKRPTRDQFDECLHDEHADPIEMDPAFVEQYYDDDLDRAIERHLAAAAVPPEDKIWQMADGTQIRVGDMTDRHVENAMRLLERRGNTQSASYSVLTAEHKRRLALRGADEEGGR